MLLLAAIAVSVVAAILLEVWLGVMEARDAADKIEQL